MLGVKYGQMVIGDGFDFGGIGGLGEGGDLLGIQIVSGGDSGEAERKECICGNGVGGVETEIAG